MAWHGSRRAGREHRAARQAVRHAARLAVRQAARQAVLHAAVPQGPPLKPGATRYPCTVHIIRIKSGGCPPSPPSCGDSIVGARASPSLLHHSPRGPGHVPRQRRQRQRQHLQRPQQLVQRWLALTVGQEQALQAGTWGSGWVGGRVGRQVRGQRGRWAMRQVDVVLVTWGMQVKQAAGVVGRSSSSGRPVNPTFNRARSEQLDRAPVYTAISLPDDPIGDGSPAPLLPAPIHQQRPQAYNCTRPRDTVHRKCKHPCCPRAPQHCDSEPQHSATAPRHRSSVPWQRTAPAAPRPSASCCGTAAPALQQRPAAQRQRPPQHHSTTTAQRSAPAARRPSVSCCGTAAPARLPRRPAPPADAAGAPAPGQAAPEGPGPGTGRARGCEE